MMILIIGCVTTYLSTSAAVRYNKYRCISHQKGMPFFSQMLTYTCLLLKKSLKSLSADVIMLIVLKIGFKKILKVKCFQALDDNDINFYLKIPIGN